MLKYPCEYFICSLNLFKMYQKCNEILIEDHKGRMLSPTNCRYSENYRKTVFINSELIIIPNFQLILYYSYYSTTYFYGNKNNL